DTYKVSHRPAGPDLELLFGSSAKCVDRGDDDGMAVVAQARGELADRRRLPRAVDPDYEDDARLRAEGQPPARVGAHHLLDELLQPLHELAFVPRLARLELLHELAGGRNAHVGA